jgi:hypothetical protein
LRNQFSKQQKKKNPTEKTSFSQTKTVAAQAMDRYSHNAAAISMSAMASMASGTM